MNSTFNNQNDKSELNPVHEDTLEYSEYSATNYIKEHRIVKDGLTPNHVKTLACSRVQWVLEQLRPQISGIFTKHEILKLLDCNQERLFISGRFSSIPSDLCDHNGIEPENYPSSPFKELVDKLLSLDSMQFFALADALEQTWHRGMKGKQTPKAFLQTLGIELL